jgi:hypothetical protein
MVPLNLGVLPRADLTCAFSTKDKELNYWAFILYFNFILLPTACCRFLSSSACAFAFLLPTAFST